MAISAIPGLDVNELEDLGNPRNPNLRGGVSPEAQAWQANRAAPAQMPSGGGLRRIAAAAQNGWDSLRGKSSMGPFPPVGKAAAAADVGTQGLRIAGKLAGPAVALGTEGKGVYDVAKDPNSSGADVATQAAEGTGKLATGWLGAQAGAALGAFGGPLAPFTVPLGTAAGGVAGYYGGEKLIHSLRSLAGVDPTSPAEQTYRRQITPAGIVAKPSEIPSFEAPAAGAPDAQVDPATLPTTSNASQGLRNVSVMPSQTPDVRAIQDRASATNRDVIDRARQIDAFGAGAHGPDGSGGVAGIQGNTLGGPASAAAFRDAVARSDLQRGISDGLRNPRTAGAALQAAEGLQGMNTQRDVAGLREQGETTRANARNNTEMRAANLRAGVETRGQDLALKGHMYQADTSLRGQIAQMLRDQFNKDREFNQRSDELQHNWSSEATKKLTDEFTSTLPQVDGKPDSERAARYANALPSFLASRTQALQDHLKLNPDDKEAQQKLEVLQRKGADAIMNNPTAKAKFLAGMQLGDVISSTATNGITPWGTRAVDSGQPVTELRRMPNGDYITDRKGVNGEPEVIPGRYVEKQGGIFGFLGKDSNRFKSLIKE